MGQDFIRTYQELQVYRLAFREAMRLYRLSQQFPPDEDEMLTRQIVTASRSVCANLAEAWGKRRYRKAFMAKLNDAEAEAAEVQTWIAFAVECDYLDAEAGQDLVGQYRTIFEALGRLVENSAAWTREE
ncbi:four helix bundle protein [Leptolyngbya cf. ectocarpi LEGE 11479]|uniref:Four helix bundle protein n=1 Tax=Leptolyngbya cf. ectocarpi LEGE 11479 TaxID=1828722 RepID=A0A928ZZ81_LEPEC|nr:four helix bundle protein [Leptolyngbya ectocarpi]MBE9070150.1 four helix bundle protein [Leptolyngbya cf. ectocarpi LEGE 11479]